MRTLYFILNGKVPEACSDVKRWAKWFETGDRIVRQEHIDAIWVSTVFLGLDHNFAAHGSPLLFETMAFDEEGASFSCARYSTWEEAEAGHASVVATTRAMVEASATSASDVIAVLRKG